jgi:hypothetical protein
VLVVFCVRRVRKNQSTDTDQEAPNQTKPSSPLPRLPAMASSALLQSSAAGYLALLEDTEDQLREHALTNLLSLVDKFWFEISEQITKMFDLRCNNG